jgi:hypothetical protein
VQRQSRATASTELSSKVRRLVSMRAAVSRSSTAERRRPACSMISPARER